MLYWFCVYFDDIDIDGLKILRFQIKNLYFEY